MDISTIKTYTIAEKKYEQRPLVFGQWQQLNRVIADLDVPAELTPRSLTGAFADRLDQILAIVLTEKDKSPRDKDLADLAEHFAFEMDPDQVAEVVTDFFDCNPIHSVLNLVVGVTQKITATVTQVTGSNEQSLSSPTETGPNETESSGE